MPTAVFETLTVGQSKSAGWGNFTPAETDRFLDDHNTSSVDYPAPTTL